MTVKTASTQGALPPAVAPKTTRMISENIATKKPI